MGHSPDLASFITSISSVPKAVNFGTVGGFDTPSSESAVQSVDYPVPIKAQPASSFITWMLMHRSLGL
jgi:hypothetical protein